jgi:hypothetical protein
MTILTIPECTLICIGGCRRADRGFGGFTSNPGRKLLVDAAVDGWLR